MAQQKDLTIPSADLPIQVAGQWYSSPERYARLNNNSYKADIFFASLNPASGEASKIPKKDCYPLPISQYYLLGPPPGGSYTHVAPSGKRSGKPAMAAQVASASALQGVEAPKPPPPLLGTQHRFYTLHLLPSFFDDLLNMAASLPDDMASVLNSEGCTLLLSFAALVNTNRASKITTSVFIAVTPQDPNLLGPDLQHNGARIRLFNRLEDIHLAHPASRNTQYKKCYHFGHSKPVYKAEHYTCPISAKVHLRAEQ
ncbi:hypothetical protein B9Z19DRAFT_1066923 [Tuber borchii]|uniref:Uncharacterized protein n=1 Tax=Tuber borchii TaxID=42251 RepID=A0A2T6ZKQ4_TUBBO|nr:hypothetical protein B9Z19DRAFT_1066923 [Tuber borchii]